MRFSNSTQSEWKVLGRISRNLDKTSEHHPSLESARLRNHARLAGLRKSVMSGIKFFMNVQEMVRSVHNAIYVNV